MLIVHSTEWSWSFFRFSFLLCVVRHPFSVIIYELYIQLASTFEDCLRQSLYELVTLSTPICSMA